MKLPINPYPAPTIGRYNQYFERQRVQLKVEEESKTDTSFGNDTDINKIVERFARTGEMPEPDSAPIYDDVTNLQGDLTHLLAKTSDARKELENIQKQAQAAKAQQAAEDAKELAELRAAKQAQLDQPGGEADPA